MICDSAMVAKAAMSSFTSSWRFLPTSAWSTMRPVMIEGSRPMAAESRMVMNTRAN